MAYDSEHTQPAYYTDTLPDAYIAIHRTCKEHSHKCEEGAAEVVAGEQGGCVLGIGHWDVDEYTLKNDGSSVDD